MTLSRTFLLTLCFLASSSSFAEDQAAPPAQPKILEVEANEVSPFLVESNGEPTSSYGISSDSDTLIDILFKYAISEKFRNYNSWALEFNDPERKLITRIANVGQIPPVIRWDGTFSKDERILPDQKYHYRLLLMLPDETLVASPWSFFQTRLKSPREGAKLSSKTINLFISPRFTVGGAQIKSKSHSDTGMGMKGDIRFVGEFHSLGFEYSTTLKGAISSTVNSSDIAYSKLGGFYLYRLSGKPQRAGWISGIPLAEGESGVLLPSEEDRALGIQAGFEVFSSSIRGSGSLPLDAELGRNMSGVLGLLEIEKRFDTMRLLVAADGGKSFFKGDMTVIGGTVGLFFESSHFMSQGLLVSYHTFSGKPADDAADGGNNGQTSVTNTAIFAGVSFQVKL